MDLYVPLKIINLLCVHLAKDLLTMDHVCLALLIVKIAQNSTVLNVIMDTCLAAPHALLLLALWEPINHKMDLVSHAQTFVQIAQNFTAVNVLKVMY